MYIYTIYIYIYYILSVEGNKLEGERDQDTRNNNNNNNINNTGNNKSVGKRGRPLGRKSRYTNIDREIAAEVEEEGWADYPIKQEFRNQSNEALDEEPSVSSAYEKNDRRSKQEKNKMAARTFRARKKKFVYFLESQVYN